ncbi:MAG: hypothetical protein RL675_974, partial [Bacteroidota bacterium]
MKSHLPAALIVSIMIAFLACQPAKQKVNPDDVPHVLVKKLTDIIVVDIFTPPVASRIYANSALAMYEAMRHQREGYPSITAKLNAFEPMPLPEKNKQYDFTLAGIKAFCETA